MFLSGQFSEQVQVLQSLGKVPVINNGLAEVFDIDKLIDQLIIALPDCQLVLNEVEKEALNFFKKLLETMRLSLGLSVTVQVKDSNLIGSGKSSVIFQHASGNLYIMRTMLPKVSTLAINTITKLTMYKWSREEDSFITDALEEFLSFQKSPSEYHPKKYDVRGRSPSQQPRPSTSASSTNTRTASSHTNSARPYSSISEHNYSPDDVSNVLGRIRKDVSSSSMEVSQSIDSRDDPAPQNQDYAFCSYKGLVTKTEVNEFPFSIW